MPWRCDARGMKRTNSDRKQPQHPAAIHKADSALIELVRLLGRQAAREFSEQAPGGDQLILANLAEKQS